MKKQSIILVIMVMTTMVAIGQVSSTDGTFSAAGTTNLGLRTNTTARVTILGSGTNIGFVGVNTASPSDWFHVNGNVRANQFNSVTGIINTIGATNLLFKTNNTTRITLLNTNGFVGINNTTPANQLDVNGAINATAYKLNGVSFGSSQWVTNGSNIGYTTGNVGIGTSTPGAKLSFSDLLNDNTDGLTWYNPSPLIYGIYRTAGPWSAPNYQQLQLNWDTGIILNPGNAYGKSYVDVQGNGLRVSAGNIGIGTTTPAAKLNIVYSGSRDYSNQAIQIETTDPSAYGSINLKNSLGDLGLFGLTGSSYNWGLFQPRQTFIYSVSPSGILLDAVDPNGFISFGTGGADASYERMHIDNVGNIGIGTSTPVSKLDIIGTINSSDKARFGGYAPLVGTASINGFSLEVGGPNPDGISGDATIFFHHHGVIGHQLRYNNGNLFLEAAGNGYGTTLTPNFIVGGNVGIGTTTPAYKLDVNGTINATSILVGGQPVSIGSSLWTNVGADINFATGKVGIGTTSPKSTLNIADNGVSVNAGDIFTGGLIIQSNTGGRSQINGAQLEFAIPANTDGSNVWGQSRIITVAANQNNWDASGKMILGTRRLFQKPGTTQSTWYYGDDLTIDGIGSIGIGTTTPAYKLDVNGTINATGILVNGLPISTAGVTTISGGTTGLTPSAATAGVITLAGTLKASNGGTGVTSVTTTPTASAFAGWDANKILKANNFTPAYTAVTTANTTTTLAVSSTYYQNFTGTSSQIVKLPVVTTLSNGHQFYFKNSSTQPVTVQTSDGTVIQALAANATLALTCISTAGGTGTASWHWVYNPNTAGITPSSQWSTTGSDIAYTTGNVGIGKTPAAGYKLDVNGTINATGILMNGLPISSGTSSQWSTTGSDITFGTGNVAIGSGSSPINGLNVFKLGDFNGGSIRYGFSGTNDGVLSLGFNSLTGRDAMKLSFFPHNSTASQNDLMTLDVNGNVGIGTNSPSTKLEVNGDANIGIDGPSVNGFGAKIQFLGASSNSDPMWISRFNNGSNYSELRMNIGDDNFADDALSIGNFLSGDASGQWKTFFKVQNNGNVAIGKSSANANLDVFGNSASSTNLILSANYNDRYRWRMKTLDRGNAIDLDFTASDNSDAEETIMQLSRSNSTRPEFRLMTDWLVANNGLIGIGTANPTQKLTVKGTVYSTEVKVDLSAGAPDYVFEKDYNLPTLDSIKNYIDKNKHLPEIPSAKEFEKNGVNLGEMNMLLLKKIEELTLLMIQQEKRIKELENKK